jgi:HlyD family secretion protein
MGRMFMKPMARVTAGCIRNEQVDRCATKPPRRLPTAVLMAIGFMIGPVSPEVISAAQAQAQSQAPSKLRTLIDRLRGQTMPEGIVRTNGRIEATQVDVSAKYSGRLAEVTVKEGDEVTAGQVIARISSPEYEAQLRGARAQVLKAKQALAEAEAMIAQRKSDQTLAHTEVERGQQLVEKGYLTKQVFDQRTAKADAANAALRAAQAQREQAQFSIGSAEAEVEQIEAILVDLTLVSPRDGRVQYQLARAGEVVNAGTRVVTILDLKDVYMTIYLPAAQAGPLALGDEARIVLDPVPQYVVPATVGFVAADAQFTPKSVETAEEREKLMFRVKLQVDPQVLARYHRSVKTGVRGVGFVRMRSSIAWPPDLNVKLP